MQTKNRKRVDMLELSNGLDDFLKYLRECQQLNRVSIAEEQEINGNIQDILHILEFEDKDYHSMAKLAKQLKELRKQRRIAKDNINVTNPIIEWLDSKDNQMVIKSLERLLGDLRKIEKNTKNRIYTYRGNDFK